MLFTYEIEEAVHHALILIELDLGVFFCACRARLAP